MRLGLEAGQDTLDLAVELNITGVPIDGHALVDQGVESTLAPLKEKDLAPCQIGAFGYNPLADNDCNTLLTKLIPLAAQTGCRYITIGPGNHHPSGFGHYDTRNFRDAALDTYAQAVKPMVGLAEQHDVVLTIEAYLKGVVHSPESFKALHQRVGSDHLRCNIDPSSLYRGLSDFLDPMPLVKHTITNLAEDVGLIHLKEVGVKEGFHLKMDLTPIGAGHTDWAAFLQQVQPHTPEDAWVIIEHCMSAEEARQSVDTIRRAAAETGLHLT